jgi:hypothetical protein
MLFTIAGTNEIPCSNFCKKFITALLVDMNGTRALLDNSRKTLPSAEKETGTTFSPRGRATYSGEF